MAKTAKVKPTATKTKKSTSQQTVCGKSNTNELPSSPRSRADRAAHRGALLNPPTDVDDPALSAVNPSVSEINYDVVSPGAARAQAKNVIGDKGINLAYDSDDSDDEDYRGDVYDDDYSDGEDSLAKYRVPSARGKGAGRKPKAGRPPKPDTKGMSQGDVLALMTDWEKNGRGTMTQIGVLLLLLRHSRILMKVWTHPVTTLQVFAAELFGK